MEIKWVKSFILFFGDFTDYTSIYVNSQCRHCMSNDRHHLNQCALRDVVYDLVIVVLDGSIPFVATNFNNHENNIYSANEMV
jgi:hypothetical protein